MNTNIHKLRKYLPLEQYGKHRAKTFDELLAEIENKECQISWEDGIPIRSIQVVNIRVYSPAGRALKEDRQEFTDGRIRRRDIKGISEKLYAGEKPLAGAIRAMREELGLWEGLYNLENNGQCNQQSISPSYPGLVTWYQVFKFKAIVNEAGYQADGYAEIKQDKTTYFRWK